MYGEQKKPTVVKGLSLKNISKKTILVKYKKSANTKSYKIQYSTDKKFKKGVKAKKTSATNCKIKSLKKNKIYYVRVCSLNGKQHSKWSNIKKIKIKK